MRNRCFGRSFSRLFAVVFLLGLLAGCGGGGGDGGIAGDEYAPIIPETTKVLDDATFSNLSSISEDKKTLTFSAATDLLDSIKTGDVIVVPESDLAPDGLLRKVSSVNQAGNGIVVETEAATLTEVIEQGAIDYSETLTAGDIEEVVTLHEGITAAGAGEPSMKLVKSVSGKIGLSINDQIMPGVRLKGNVELSVTPTFSARIKWASLKKLTAKAKAAEDASVRIIGEYTFNVSKKKKIGELRFRPVVVWVGWVPVYIRPVIEVRIGVDGNAESSLSTSVSQSLSYTAGIEYDGAWRVVNEMEKTFDYTPPSLDADASAKGYVKPRLVFYIYGVGGPYAGVEGYLKLTADINKDPWCDLLAGLGGTAGITGKILSVNLGSIEKDLFNIEASLYRCKKPYMVVQPGSDLLSTGPEGGPFAASSIAYTIKGKYGSVDWQAAKDAAWLDLSISGGTVDETTSNDLVAAINSSANDLPQGTYKAVLTLTNTKNGEGNTKRFVTLSVREKSMSVTPGPDAYLLGAAPEGGDFSNLAMVDFAIASDAGTIDWEIQESADWLTVSPSSGSVTEGAPVTATVTVDAAAAQALPAKTHAATLTFSNKSNGKGDTTRTLFLQPLMNVTPTSFGASGPEGGPFDDRETFQVRAVNGDIPWTATSSTDWIKISESSGTAPAGGASDIVVSIDSDTASGLAQGTHTGEVTFTNTGSGNLSDETEVTVTLTVKEPLQVTPSQLSFSGPPGGQFSPSSGAFTVEADADVSFEVTTDDAWLDVTTSSGTVGPSAPATVNVSVNSGADSFTEGTYTATLTFAKTTGVRKELQRTVVLNVSSACSAGPDAFAYDLNGYSYLDFLDEVPGSGACGFSDAYSGAMEFHVDALFNKLYAHVIDALGDGWFFESVNPTYDWRSPYWNDRSLAYLSFDTDTVITMVRKDADGNILGRYSGTFILHAGTTGVENIPFEGNPPSVTIEVKEWRKIE